MSEGRLKGAIAKEREGKSEGKDRRNERERAGKRSVKVRGIGGLGSPLAADLLSSLQEFKQQEFHIEIKEQN